MTKPTIRRGTPSLSIFSIAFGKADSLLVVARWAGEFDDKKARVFGTSEEVKRELAAGEIALAEAAQGD